MTKYHIEYCIGKYSLDCTRNIEYDDNVFCYYRLRDIFSRKVIFAAERKLSLVNQNNHQLTIWAYEDESINICFLYYDNNVVKKNIVDFISPMVESISAAEIIAKYLTC